MGWRGILGFEYGIVQAPLGPDMSGPQLVAAVANAGALGLLRAPDWVSEVSILFSYFIHFNFPQLSLSLSFSGVTGLLEAAHQNHKVLN